MITLTADEERSILQRRKDLATFRQKRFRAIRECLKQISKKEQKRWKAQFRCGQYAFLKPSFQDAMARLT